MYRSIPERAVTITSALQIGQSNSLILDINLGAHKDRKEQCLMYINDKGRVFEEEDPLKEKYICTEEGEGLVRC